MKEVLLRFLSIDCLFCAWRLGSFLITSHFAVKPTSVSILEKPGHVSANKELEVVCQAVGGYPPPKLTWWLGSKMLRPDDEVRLCEKL